MNYLTVREIQINVNTKKKDQSCFTPKRRCMPTEKYMIFNENDDLKSHQMNYSDSFSKILVGIISLRWWNTKGDQLVTIL